MTVPALTSFMSILPPWSLRILPVELNQTIDNVVVCVFLRPDFGKLLLSLLLQLDSRDVAHTVYLVSLNLSHFLYSIIYNQKDTRRENKSEGSFKRSHLHFLDPK